MGIINTNVNTTPLTPAQLLQSQADNYKAALNNLYQQNVRLAEAMTRFIWGDPTKAQERFDLFGADAADLLKVSAAFVALVATYTGQAPTIIPDGYSVAANNDGSVTVTPTPTPTV